MVFLPLVQHDLGLFLLEVIIRLPLRAASNEVVSLLPTCMALVFRVWSGVVLLVVKLGALFDMMACFKERQVLDSGAIANGLTRLAATLAYIPFRKITHLVV